MLIDSTQDVQKSEASNKTPRIFGLIWKDAVVINYDGENCDVGGGMKNRSSVFYLVGLKFPLDLQAELSIRQLGRYV